MNNTPNWLFLQHQNCTLFGFSKGSNVGTVHRVKNQKKEKESISDKFFISLKQIVCDLITSTRQVHQLTVSAL